MKAGLVKQSLIHRILNRGIAVGVLVVFIALLAPFAPGVFSQESKPEMTGDERIHITSDRMISRQVEQLVEFSGEVRATQGNTVINADLLRIHFKDGESFPAGEDGNEDAIEKLVALGNVVIDHENRKAYSEKAVYTSSDGLLILSGEKVVVKEDGNSITGQKVVLNRNTGEIIITGETGRVEAFFEQNTESRIRSDENNPSGGK